MKDRVEVILDNDDIKNVLYLMQRDHRIDYNYSMTLAYDLSYKSKSSLFLGCNIDKMKKNKSQHGFIVEGLLEMAEKAKGLNLELYNITNLTNFIRNKKITCVITEYSPLRDVISYQEEIKGICENENCALYICDSHNLVPCKQLGSYCKSPRGVKVRLYKLWNKYFLDQNNVEKHKYNKLSMEKQNSDGYCLMKDLDTTNVENKTVFKGGASTGHKMLDLFITNKLGKYKKMRNCADYDYLSDLSPWIHHGQLGVCEIIKKIKSKITKEDENVDCFISETFAWKATAEHFCLHEKNYDNIDGALEWAKQTLLQHKNDRRDVIYSFEDLEKGNTHDHEWNAGQKEMVIRGKMHGYVRMYWAKKFLSWTETPEKAVEYAVRMNDKYTIDGNDPNGYLGIMWSICGAMDQGWREREIFGKIRGMSGIKAKKYVEKWKKEVITDLHLH